MNRCFKVFQTRILGHEVGPRDIDLGRQCRGLILSPGWRPIFTRESHSDLFQFRYLVREIEPDSLVLKIRECLARQYRSQLLCSRRLVASGYVPLDL